MKNSKKVALSAGALMLSALSFTNDAQAVNNSSNLLSFRNLGTGSEMRSELFNANNPIESAKNFEATCGEKGKEATCGEKGKEKAKEAKCGEKGKEAKCGEKGKEATCGEKGKEAKCGEKGKEAKCGEKGKEAKCGEKTPKN